MIRTIVFLMLVSGALWAQSPRLALAGNISYISWTPTAMMFDMQDGWRAVWVGRFASPSSGIQAEYVLSEAWTVFGRANFWPHGNVVVIFGDLTARWYGNDPAPAGIGIGMGLSYFQSPRFFSLFPQVSASYKWIVGRHFFIEPEVALFSPYHYLDLGFHVRLAVGWVF